MVSADDIDNGLKVDGFPTTSFGVTLTDMLTLTRLTTATLMTRSIQPGFHFPDVAIRISPVLAT